MRQQPEPQGSLLMDCGTLLAQKPKRPTWLPAKLQAWLIKSQTGTLTGSCISQLCTPPAASVEPSCPGNFSNLPSIRPVLWDITILWNAEIVFLQTCTDLNFSMHYTLFPPLRSKKRERILPKFCYGCKQMMSMELNKAAPAAWTHLHCRGIWLGIHSGQLTGQFYYFPLWPAEGRLPKK